MNTSPLGAAALAVSGLCLVAGCQHAVVPPLRVDGSSSFRFVERPAQSASTQPATEPAPRQPVDVVAPAEPILPLATPVYPRAVLGRVRLPVTVGVRISVGAEGRVAHVGASLLALSTGGEFAEEFRAAVEEAVAQWRFTPAEIRHLVPRTGPGGNEYWVATRGDKTDYAFDLSFVFSATGDVISEVPR